MSSTKTGIEWTGATWNPIRGCSRVSEGCRNCYAEKQAARIISCDRGRGVPEGEGAYDGLLAAGGQWNGQVRVVPEALEQPKRWKKPRRIFVNSMADLFHENVPDEFISRVFEVMALCPQHTFQILTKRPKRMLNYFACLSLVGAPESLFNVSIGRWPLPNVWIGVSVEDQKTADARIPLLLQVPAMVRWVSAEPLLGPISLDSTLGGTQWIGGQRGCNGMHRGIGTDDCPNGEHHHHDNRCRKGLDWVVVGGESGKEARPMHPDWVRSLRDQCAEAGTAFLFKQWGEWGQYVNEAHYTHCGEEKQPHAWIDSETAEWGYCWPIDDDGIWSNFSGNPRMSALGLRPEITVMGKHGKKAAGRLLDGVLHDAYPGELA